MPPTFSACPPKRRAPALWSNFTTNSSWDYAVKSYFTKNHYKITTVQCDLTYSVTYAIVCVDPKQYLNIAQQGNFYLATHLLLYRTRYYSSVWDIFWAMLEESILLTHLHAFSFFLNNFNKFARDQHCMHHIISSLCCLNICTLNIKILNYCHVNQTAV